MGDPRANRLGVRGEDIAAVELERQGMTVLARNWRCGQGELDLVAAETVAGRTTVVFCEVKCRSGLGFGDPLEAVTWSKLRKVRQLGAEWLRVNDVSPAAIRVDAIGVVLPSGGSPIVRHVRGAG